MDVPEIVVPFPSRTRDLTLIQMRPEGLWGQSRLLFNACLVLFPRGGGKAGREADQSEFRTGLNSEAISTLSYMSPRT